MSFVESVTYIVGNPVIQVIIIPIMLGPAYSIVKNILETRSKKKNLEKILHLQAASFIDVVESQNANSLMQSLSIKDSITLYPLFSGNWQNVFQVIMADIRLLDDKKASKVFELYKSISFVSCALKSLAIGSSRSDLYNDSRDCIDFYFKKAKKIAENLKDEI